MITKRKFDTIRNPRHTFSIVFGTIVAKAGSIYSWKFRINKYYYEICINHLWFGLMKQDPNDNDTNTAVKHQHKQKHNMYHTQFVGMDLSHAKKWNGKRATKVSNQSLLKPSGTPNQIVIMTLDMKTDEKNATLKYIVNGVKINDVIVTDASDFVLAYNEIEIIKLNVR